MKCIKSLTLFALLTAFMCGCASEATVSSPLRDCLEDAVANGQYFYVHQDALPYGHGGWIADPAGPFDKCDVSEVCGDLPAIVGFDLGGIEMDADQNLDGVPFEVMRKAAEEQVARGGFVTFSWHLRNPLTGGDAWDVSSDQVVASILDGGDCHELFMVWLSRVADFLESIKDPSGNPISCIFRPWHENTGSWFWWGAGLCSEQEYIDLWALTYDYLVYERGLDNFLWAYSPSSTDLQTKAMDRYPGDDIIDIIGVDRYDYPGGTEVHQDFIDGMRSDLSFLGAVAEEHGLLLAVTETGQESITCPTWWTEALTPAVEGYPICYVLTWRNAHERPTHFFGPWKGAACEQDFVDYYNSDRTLFLSDIQ